MSRSREHSTLAERDLRARLIINPVSGADEANERSSTEIVAALDRFHIRCEVIRTARERSSAILAQAAVAEGCDMVIVCGGDGTVSEVCAGMVRAPIPLGIVPMGTFNNIARSLGLPTTVNEACEVIGRQHSRVIDAGLANEETWFFEAAGVGLDAALFPLGEEIKGGRWSRLFHVARITFQYRVQPIDFEFDTTVAEASVNRSCRFFRKRRIGKITTRVRVRALFAAVANGPYYGSGFMVAPGARMSDGKLTVSIYRGFSKWELLCHFRAIANGRHRYTPKLETYIARTVRISSPARLPVHADGHPQGETPVTLRAVPDALRIFVPEGPPPHEPTNDPAPLG